MAKVKTVRYKKKLGTGRHSFSFKGKRYSLVPGDVIELPESYSLGSHISQYIVIGEESRRKQRKQRAKKQQPDQKALKVVKGQDGYDVINPDNPEKPLNSNPLTKKEASKLAGTESKPTEWDELVAIMQSMGLEVLDEYETEDQLREAIQAVEDAE